MCLAYVPGSNSLKTGHFWTKQGPIGGKMIVQGVCPGKWVVWVIHSAIFGMCPLGGEFHHDEWTIRTLDSITNRLIYTAHITIIVCKKNTIFRVPEGNTKHKTLDPMTLKKIVAWLKGIYEGPLRGMRRSARVILIYWTDNDF
jgi:hypothetical protein